MIVSRDFCTYVLCRVRHLVNRTVVFLEYHVFFLSCEATTPRVVANACINEPGAVFKYDSARSCSCDSLYRLLTSCNIRLKNKS